MLNTLRLYFIALAIFLVIDILWIGVIANSLYQSQIGHLMKPNINWLAAFVFYALFIFGLIFFVIDPQKSLTEVILRGALFGLITYATYDLTNLALTKDWPLLITVVDLAWGTFLCATVSGLTYVINKKIGL